MVHNTPEQGLTRGLRHQPQELVPAELPRSKELEAQQRAGTAGTRAPSWGSHLSTSEGPQESSAGPCSNPQVLRGRRCGQSHIQAAKGFPGGPGLHAHPTHRLPPQTPATLPRCPLRHLPALAPHHKPCGHLHGGHSHGLTGQRENRGERAGERACCVSSRCVYLYPSQTQHPFVKARSAYSQGCQFSGMLQVFDMEILAVGMDVPR